MGRWEMRITINRPLKTVFDIYTQPDTWGWTDMRTVTWTRGKPWEVDSRMEFVPKESFGVTVDQVLTHFEPYRRVEFISHFGGVTLLSHIQFKALAQDQTEIYCQLEYVGTFSRVAGFALGSAIEKGARRFYEELRRECEKNSSAASAE
jgi:hypothetical protein